MTREDQVWAGWLTAVVCSGLALEFTMRGKLCHSLRKWLRIEPRKPGYRLLTTAFVGALGGFFAWLTGHLLDWHDRD